MQEAACCMSGSRDGARPAAQRLHEDRPTSGSNQNRDLGKLCSKAPPILARLGWTLAGHPVHSQGPPSQPIKQQATPGLLPFLSLSLMPPRHRAVELSPWP